MARTPRLTFTSRQFRDSAGRLGNFPQRGKRRRKALRTKLPAGRGGKARSPRSAGFPRACRIRPRGRRQQSPTPTRWRSPRGWRGGGERLGTYPRVVWEIFPALRIRLTWKNFSLGKGLGPVSNLTRTAQGKVQATFGGPRGRQGSRPFRALFHSTPL